MHGARTAKGAAGRPQTLFARARLVASVAPRGIAFPESWRMTPAFVPLSPP